ncbi:MAG: T9SS type A sorting domain-containing protein [Candidatus Sabulitectum sp.]|nr:T9SS type A sorting domain-containing protein [Candidatus Sabulitectum sp.]
MDLILSNYYGKLFLYTRQSNGTLTEEPVLCGDGYEIDMGYWCGPALVDWDENGHLDLIVSGYGSGMFTNRFTLFMNTNEDPDSPVFTFNNISKIEPVFHRWRQGIRVFDLNIDGKKDLINGSETGEVYFHENIGTNASPEFDGKVLLATASGAIDIGSRSRACLLDWNDDGVPDMIIGENGGNLYLALGVPGVGNEEQTEEEIANEVMSLSVLENPSSGLHIPVQFSSPSAGMIVINMFDLHGRLLEEREYAIEAGASSLSLDASGLPPGVVILRAVLGNSSVSERVVITR